jgi:predicted transcriptional regulator
MAPVGNAYNQHAITLHISERVRDVANYLLTSYQPDFAVMQGGSLLGIVTREEVARALAEGRGDAYVTMVMRRDVVRVGADDSLDYVRQVMTERNTRVVAVYDGEHYRGLVSIEDIVEALQVYRLLWRQAPAQAKAA